MAESAIVSLLPISILLKRPTAGSGCLYFCKISYAYLNRLFS